MFQILIKIAHLFLYITDFYSRYKDGVNNLNKGLPKAKSINNEQKIEILNFWKPFLNTIARKKAFNIKWYDIFNRTNVFGHDLRLYIPDSYYYCITDRFLTNPKNCPVLDDKNLYDMFFSDVNQPKTLARKIDGVYQNKEYQIISEDEVVGICVKNGNAILKPSVDACAGAGIVFWRSSQNSEQELREALRKVPNYIIQDIIKQNKVFNDLNESSVNTMRMVTLLWKGEVHLTTAVAIIGGKGSKVNHLHRGGIVCGIEPDGRLKHTAFDGNLNEYQVHPSGVKFTDVSIPNYDKCVALVKRLAPRLAGNAKLLNWDITLDEAGEPLLIEVNLTRGGSVQIAGGPAFGKLTKEILDEVCK